MAARLSVLLAAATLALLVGGWWLVRPDALPAVGAIGSAEADRLAGAVADADAPVPAGCGPQTVAEALGWQAPDPERLVAGADMSAAQRVAELVADLRMLHPTSRFNANEVGVVRRLEQFVFDVAAAGQVAPAVVALEQQLDGLPVPAGAAVASPAGPLGSVGGTVRVGVRRSGEPQTTDGWLSARLMVALAGLGAPAPVIERWPRLVPVERADVLVALGWDPLADADAPRLETRRADGLVRGVPLLPLVLTRPPSAEVLAFLRERLHEPTRGLHGLRVRDASLLVLGVGLGRVPECLPLIEASLRADPAGSYVALFTITASDTPAARSLLARLRRRHAEGHPVHPEDLPRHERFALELGHALVAARGESLLDLAALRTGLAPGRDADARLAGAARVLARVSDGVPQIQARKTLSDMLVGSLANERDRDVAWLELLALRQLHIGEAWLPSRTIGYGAEDGLDADRAAERTATFLAYLSSEHAATRRLAVLGLLGSSDGRGIEKALAAALAAEEDGRIAKWMRLALLRL